ncbi:hypothetical protein [Halorarius litoreus]|uniref:hypothetical protein n=1 Tax=Halorarius litoreus TaxID=2962676 RepID=UPI0020CFA536|nr:hypothetical protein [Halorarius litoreus]
MEKHRLIPMVMAVAGFAAIGIGVYQGLVHVAPGYEGTVISGWDGSLSHEEVLLVQLGAVGVGGLVAGLRWKRLSAVPFVIGSLVLFYALRAVFHLFQSPRPLYREFAIQGAGFEGDTVMFVLGAEPFLLAAGGLLLMGAGIKVFRLQQATRNGEEMVPQSSRV